MTDCQLVLVQLTLRLSGKKGSLTIDDETIEQGAM